MSRRSIPVLGLKLPSDVYHALTVRAERDGVQVHQLIEATMTDLTRNPTTAPTPREGTWWRRFGSPEDLERLRELHAQGWSDRRIADELGTTQPVISRRRREMGLDAWYGFEARRRRQEFERRRKEAGYGDDD